MSINLIRPEFRKCRNCGFAGETIETDCPKCRRPLLVSQVVRTAGAFMMICGVVLVVIIGYVINYTNQYIIESAKTGALLKWKASPTETEAFYTIFYMVFMFGVGAVIAGAWHLATGRSNRLLMYVLFGSAIILIVGAKILYLMF